jgi:hypothetical protein
MKVGEDTTVRTDARFSLRKTEDGGFAPSAHLLRREPELERPYFGVRFTEEDKKNLLSTGNLGRVAEAEFKRGEKTPVLISIDRQTNELVAVRADRVNVSNSIKGVELDDAQKKDLSEGKALWIEGMTSKKGTEFSAYLQYNADKRGFEFRFDNDRQQSQTRKQGGEQSNVPKTFRGKELTEENRDSLREGKTVHVDGLVDRKGKGYSGYITMNKETGKTDFMFPKQYKEAVEKGRAIPDDRSKTQVAVNSEGKTNEATKKVDSPPEKGQTQPTEKQAAKTAEKRERKKPKKAGGMKM